VESDTASAGFFTNFHSCEKRTPTYSMKPLRDTVLPLVATHIPDMLPLLDSAVCSFMDYTATHPHRSVTYDEIAKHLPRVRKRLPNTFYARLKKATTGAEPEPLVDITMALYAEMRTSDEFNFARDDPLERNYRDCVSLDVITTHRSQAGKDLGLSDVVRGNNMNADMCTELLDMMVDKIVMPLATPAAATAKRPRLRGADTVDGPSLKRTKQDTK